VARQRRDRVTGLLSDVGPAVGYAPAPPPASPCRRR